MGKNARRAVAGGASLVAAGALAAGIAKHESGGGEVPVNDPDAKVTLRIGRPLVFNTVRREDGGLDLIPIKRPGKPVTIHETKDGGLRATTSFGNRVSMDLELPAAGPNAAEPDLTPDDDEPRIQYDPPGESTFWNTAEVDGETVYFRDSADFGDRDAITLQQDGHGGLVAFNAAGEPMQITIHLPAPGTENPHGQHGHASQGPGPEHAPAHEPQK